MLTRSQRFLPIAIALLTAVLIFPPPDAPTGKSFSFALRNPEPTIFSVWESPQTDRAPVTRNFDGVEMVLVPAGCFMMGSTEAQIDQAFELAQQSQDADVHREWFLDETPAHRICFDKPFWIDKFEVTNGQFTRFGGRAHLSGRWHDETLPREEITWPEARDFCALRGSRLPTEAEWEYAARGPESLIYPWSNEFDADCANCEANSEMKTVSVGGKTGGKSWVGAYDLSGNVWEWVSSMYSPYPYIARDGREALDNTVSLRVLRGGSLISDACNLRGANRSWDYPYDAHFLIGFRCARSIEDTFAVRDWRS